MRPTRRKPRPSRRRATASWWRATTGSTSRAKPSAASDVVYVLPYGMVLTVLGEAEGGFLHVQWANYTGYVSAQYVTPFGAP